MAEFKLGRIKFVYQGTWAPSTSYVVDDVVTVGGKTYICVQTNTSSSLFATDLTANPSNWNLVADGTQWKGSWTNGVYYNLGDLTIYGGIVYQCTTSHTSVASNAALTVTGASGNTTIATLTFATQVVQPFLIGSSITVAGINPGGYNGTFTITAATTTSVSYTNATTTTYVNGGSIIGTLQTGLENDQSKWTAFAANFNWSNAWAVETRYKARDLVTYGGYTYVCNAAHVSAATSTLGLETDQSKWDTFNAGIIYLGAWSGSTVRYRVNDVVKYGADIWICTASHTSTSTFNSGSFSVFVNGFEFANTWNSTTAYILGDIVTYGGNAYTAIVNGTNQNPVTQTSYWQLFTTGFTFAGDWLSSTGYLIGDVVRVGAYTYVATADSSNITPPNIAVWQRLNTGIKWAPTNATYSGIASANIISSGSTATFNVTASKTVYTVAVAAPGTGYAINDTLKVLGSNLGGLSPANDVLITVTGVSSGGITTISTSGYSVTWVTGVTYVLGDAVYFGANTYICVAAHVAGSGNRPDADTTGTTWNLLASGAESAVLTTQGDMFYYGANGPQRLPIGTDGQVLRVSNNKPAWLYYGSINNIVYVSPVGTDSAGGGQGTTIDKPWKTIRYATKQVEDGYLNTSAALLIAKNKQFMMKEVSNYVVYNYSFNITASSASNNQFTVAAGTYQATTANMSLKMPISFTGTVGGVTAGTTYYVLAIIDATHFTITATYGGVVAVTLTTATANMTGALVYNTVKCERDAGLLIEAVQFDLSHGGTALVTAAALSYFTSALSSTFITTNFGYEVTQSIAAYAYMNSALIPAVLGNTAPAISYQSLTGATPVAIQRIDSTLTTETTAVANSQALLSIVTTALTAGTATVIAPAIQPNTTINVKTGTYNEVLPMVIPRNTAVVGDELRSTVIQPASAIANLVNDKSKSISALNRIKAIIPNLIANTSITPTTGNTQTQVTTLPAGDVGSTVATASVSANAELIYDIVNNGVSNVPSFVLPTLTGYNVGFLAGYGDGKAQVVQNYTFVKADVSAYINVNYPSVWSALGATGQANCQRDIGYILDAIQYDMTYGTNTQTLIAGSAYYSNYILTIGATERVAILAAYAFLKTEIGNIVTKTAITPQAGNGSSQVTSGAAGSAGASTFAQARIQDIIDWINNGIAGTSITPVTSGAYALVSASLQTSYTALQARRTEIQSDTVVWVQKNYQSLNFTSATCYRDAGYIVDALSFDLLFGSNFNSITVGRAYNRATPSALIVINNQKTAELGAINFIKYKARAIASAGAAAQISSLIDSITGYINGGSKPRYTWPDFATIGANTAAASKIIWQNKAFIQAEVSSYLGTNYSSVWTAILQASCLRDVGYIVDAVRYDLTYGGSRATKQAGQAYYSYATLEIAASEKAATLAAMTLISTLVSAIAQGAAYTPLQGTVTRITGTTGTSTEGTAAAALITIISNIVNNGLTAGVQTVTVTTIASTSVFTTSVAHGLQIGDEVTPQSTANGLASGTTYYVVSTPLTTTFTLAATWGGTAITTFTNGTGLSIVSEITNNSTTTWVAATMTSSATILSANKATIQASVLSYIATNFPNLVYNTATCSRDVGYIIDAISYDFMLGSNYRSVRAGMSYYEAQASLVITSQKAATIAAFNYLQLQIATSLVANTTALANANTNMTTLIGIISNGIGETPEVHGTLTYNNTLATFNGAEILRANKTFLAYEAAAWTSANFGGTITTTNSTGNVITTSNNHNLTVGDPVSITATTVITSATATTVTTNLVTLGTTVGMVVNMPISFIGTGFGNLTSGTQYFIKSIANLTQLTISTTSGGSTFALTSAIGSMAATAGGLFGGLISLVPGTTSTIREYYVLSVLSPTTFTLTTTQAGTGTQTATAVSSGTGIATVTYYYAQSSCIRDTQAYIDAMIYDLNYTGNYKSLRAAKLYNNAVGGSISENMFLARNGTGIRNVTMSGLTGYLTNPNSFGTKRPTAGAYTSLEPGFGPNDANAWITTRSPYTQNCTMFGTACIGAKVDGALHAGGNRSMVANDYTTIISDGIGYWVTGSNAVAELVSVFNYYGYAGYLAELGGKIRATNGNSSYGTYGVVAEGTDTYELPIYGTLNNRANQAYVTNVVTDATNQVLRFEYANAGSNYTNSVASVNGSGFNAAATHDEFRDAAVFETRLLDANNGQGVGGSSYVTQLNVSQGGSVGYVTIAATDTLLTGAYAGMRIQLIAGTGVGQYANILTYTNGSKIAQIYKDSFTNLTVTATTVTSNLITVASTASLYTGMPVYFATAVGGLSANTVYYVIAAGFTSTQFSVSGTLNGGAVTLSTTSAQTVTLYAAGWDHVVPGTTILDTVDLTSGYIIEPRVSYSAPGYTATARTLSASSTWASLTYGAGRYVALSNGTAGSFSTDGKTWSATGGGLANVAWNSLVYAGGQGALATATVGGLGGSNAQLTAVIGTGLNATQIVSVTIVNGGYNFVTPPVILFTNGGGSGATATCTILNGAIASVTMTINGSGYTSAPTVTAVTSEVTAITMTAWGKNYFSVPTVTVSQPQGLNPTVYPISGAVTSSTYYQTTVGRIYLCTISGTTSSTVPTFDFTSSSQTQVNGTATLQYIATQAQATANLTNAGVSTIVITNNGYGYTSTPTATILDTAARFVAVSSGATNSAYVTVANLASTWTAGGALPASNFNSVAYGNGYLVAVGGTSTTPSAASSTDTGTTWINRSGVITGAVTYSHVAYGNGYFVAIPATGLTTAICTNGQNWSAGGNLPSSTTWTSITYGNGRFVAVASGGTAVAYSINNGTTWVAAAAGLPVSATWSKVRYGAGQFIAIAQSTAACATSPNGINWTAQAMPSSSNWMGLAFGNVLSTTLGAQPLWVAISATTGTIAASIRSGATPLGRIKVSSGVVTEVRMIEPGSGFAKGNITATTTSTNLITTDDTTNLAVNQPVEFNTTQGGLTTNVTYYVIGSITASQFQVSTTIGGSAVALTTTTSTSMVYRAGPILTQTDPNKVNTANMRVRTGDGALGNPSFSNRGTNNATATATTNGDGYADIYQNSSYVNIAGLFGMPAAGSNVTFGGISSTWYKLVSVTNILGVVGNYTATFQINPALTTLVAPAHGALITTSLKYSQVRLTGHDFLYIGTGNQTQTNYPFVVPANAVVANQQLFTAGGRVFFTSTDQDGNFNVGNLFGVQQATGTASLNASAFNLAGLQSLQLGAVSLGIGSATITQFSTDPYFTANSDNIVPTQKAIKSYITAQIGGGSSSLNVNTLTSGQIYVANNTISNTTGAQILVTSKMNFVGGIDGAPVALAFFSQR